MSIVERTIILKTNSPGGHTIPAALLGRCLSTVQRLVRQAILMVLEGRSEAAAAPTPWLLAAAELRLLSLDECGGARLRFETMPLREVVPPAFMQLGVWSHQTSFQETGLDLLARVIAEVDAENGDSATYDVPLLRRLRSLECVLNDPYNSITIGGHDKDKSQGATFDRETARHATTLWRRTPRSQRAILVGVMQTIHQAAGSFILRLDNGEQALCGYTGSDVQELNRMAGERVMVRGYAVFRPSGRLLRIDANSLYMVDAGSSFWSHLPRAHPQEPVTRILERLRPQKPGGMAAIFGQWPGSETEEQRTISKRGYVVYHCGCGGSSACWEAPQPISSGRRPITVPKCWGKIQHCCFL